MTAHARRQRASQRGQALLLALGFSGILILSLSSLVAFVTLGARTQRQDVASAQALALAEAGLDKAVYELNQDGGYAGEADTALGAGTFTVAVTAIDASRKRIAATGYMPDAASPVARRTVKAEVSINTDVVSFQFGVQAGDGGADLQNSASIRGNLYSTGPVTGANSNIIRGDAISAGPSGLLNGIHATSSGYAHAIQNSTIDGDAYYQSISGTTVGGTSHPGSPDQATSSLPITDAQIAEWENDAAAGGTISSPCPYKITSSVTIGPKKINCDLEIKNNSTVVTLTGPVWVNGKITFENSPTIRVDSSLGGTGVAVIADNPTNQTTSSSIDIRNSAVFEGAGSGSYVLLVSQNKSAEQGGEEEAISAENSAEGALLLYAGHGLISLANNTSLKEVTGWKIRVQNSAEVVYETGLASALFSAGPGGSWGFVPGTYVISQ